MQLLSALAGSHYGRPQPCLDVAQTKHAAATGVGCDWIASPLNAAAVTAPAVLAISAAASSCVEVGVVEQVDELTPVLHPACEAGD